MHKVAYLALVPDLFDGDQERLFVLKDKTLEEVQPLDLKNTAEELICVQIADLTHQLRQKDIELPSNIVDLEEARRLVVGLPSKENAAYHWNVWSVLKRQKSYNPDIKIFKKLAFSQILVGDIDNLLEVCMSFLLTLQEAWLETIKLLEDEAELDRYFKIELPIAKIFSKRQYLGIGVDQDKLGNIYQQVKSDKYKAYLRIADTLNTSPSEFNYRNIQSYLVETELGHLSGIDDISQLELSMKLAAETSDLAKDIVSMLSSDRNLRALAKLSNPAGRCYPTYKITGTVTGRILLQDPYLQGLKKAYRSVLMPDENTELFYLDYDHFEPGILASLSNDVSLQKMYEGDDLYTEFSKVIFGTEQKRALAKRIFISFLYGMSEEGLVKVLLPSARENSDDTDAIKLAIRQFFLKLETVMEYKKCVQKELEHNARISTPLGGHRKRKSTGALTESEKRWALNQKVQGTASLIFKEAMIKIAGEFGSECLLLPMHDAILFQLPQESAEGKIDVVKEIMENAMRNRCSRIQPKVSVENFS